MNVFIAGSVSCISFVTRSLFSRGSHANLHLLGFDFRPLCQTRVFYRFSHSLALLRQVLLFLRQLPPHRFRDGSVRGSGADACAQLLTQGVSQHLRHGMQLLAFQKIGRLLQRASARRVLAEDVCLGHI